MIANKAFKFRLYPNVKQQVMFSKTFGCVRFVYNKMLADKIAHYEATGEMLHNTPARYKKEYEWLREVDSLALANAQLHLRAAYVNFFRNKSVGFPKFKSKKTSWRSYTTNNQNGSVRIENGKLKLPKVGWVRIKLHRQIPQGHVIKSVTISQEPSGKYYASVLTEYELDVLDRSVDADKSLGLDYSSPHFYIDSNGHEADMPHFFREAEKRLAREQRKLSKMVRGSHNYQKQKRKVALAHEKVRNCRKDWLHKESTRLAETYDLIAVEDINYKGMARGLRLAKATNDNAFGRFKEMLTYKMAERGKKLITIDKWFPSSKTCRFCGNIYSDLQLTDREWDCPCCGAHILRDHNAAINIKEQGLAMVA